MNELKDARRQMRNGMAIVFVLCCFAGLNIGMIAYEGPNAFDLLLLALNVWFISLATKQYKIWQGKAIDLELCKIKDLVEKHNER